jgi:hypothetical protein
MSHESTFDNGNWNAICDVCGREFRASQMTQRWDGLMVCKDDWEPRQPQDFVRGVADKIAPPWVRPEPRGGGIAGSSGDTFIPTGSGPGGVCTNINSQGVADYGVADCARADIDMGLRYQCTAEGSVAIVGQATVGCFRVGQTQVNLNQFFGP